MFGIANVIILKRWYAAGNGGLPHPQVIAAPAYLYGVLALASEFLQGLPVVLSVGLTVGLWYAVHPAQAKKDEPATATKPKTSLSGTNTPQTRSVKTSG